MRRQVVTGAGAIYSPVEAKSGVWRAQPITARLSDSLTNREGVFWGSSWAKTKWSPSNC